MSQRPAKVLTTRTNEPIHANNVEAQRTRGWTNALIRAFLPTPDDTTVNPVYKSKARVKLYAVDRVEQIELTEDFRRELAKVPRARKQPKSRLPPSVPKGKDLYRLACRQASRT